MEPQPNPDISAKITAGSTVIGASLGLLGAFVGAIATFGAAYVNVLKPSETQVVSSGQYKALVDENAQKTVQLGELQQTVQQLKIQQQRMSESLTGVQRTSGEVSTSVPPASMPAAPLGQAQPQEAAVTPQVYHGPKSESPQRAVSNTNLDTEALLGRWVGVAECKKRDYPMSIDFSSGTKVELRAIYSDSLNGQKYEATFLVLPPGPNRPSTLSFRTYDDRFIVLKNGHRLTLRDTGELVTSGDATDNCSVILSKS